MLKSKRLLAILEGTKATARSNPDMTPAEKAKTTQKFKQQKAAVAARGQPTGRKSTSDDKPDSAAVARTNHAGKALALLRHKMPKKEKDSFEAWAHDDHPEHPGRSNYEHAAIEGEVNRDHPNFSHLATSDARQARATRHSLKQGWETHKKNLEDEEKLSAMRKQASKEEKERQKQEKRQKDFPTRPKHYPEVGEQDELGRMHHAINRWNQTQNAQARNVTAHADALSDRRLTPAQRDHHAGELAAHAAHLRRTDSESGEELAHRVQHTRQANFMSELEKYRNGRFSYTKSIARKSPTAAGGSLADRHAEYGDVQKSHSTESQEDYEDRLYSTGLRARHDVLAHATNALIKHHGLKGQDAVDLARKHGVNRHPDVQATLKNAGAKKKLSLRGYHYEHAELIDRLKTIAEMQTAGTGKKRRSHGSSPGTKATGGEGRGRTHLLTPNAVRAKLRRGRDAPQTQRDL